MLKQFNSFHNDKEHLADQNSSGRRFSAFKNQLPTVNTNKIYQRKERSMSPQTFIIKKPNHGPNYFLHSIKIKEQESKFILSFLFRKANRLVSSQKRACLSHTKVK